MAVNRKNLQIGINAQLLPASGSGGVESIVIGLVHALGQLNDGPEEYTIIGPWQDPTWLEPYIGPNQRIVRGPRPAEYLLGRSMGALRSPARKLRDFLVRSLGISGLQHQVPISSGFYESLGCDVIHFCYQQFVICARPTIYNAHDLQHLHYPQFFSPSTIAGRETIYPAGCHFAHTVVAISYSTKADVVRHYHVSPDKVQVIPWAPPTQTYPEPTPDALATIREKYRLSTPFAFYPAMTWPHKNHIRLLEALALLRDRDHLKVYLVCSGYKNEFWHNIESRIAAYELHDQVKFLGLVPPEDLRAIYRQAQFVVFPTLFEGAGLPVLEAWQEGTPIACSNVTSLPEYAGDAALLFDPFSVEAIAGAVARMATNPDLCETLRERGALRLKAFSWERTAKAYRAVYRRAAGYPLSEEDNWLLSWDWMKQPQRKMEAQK
jgi:glycosyltransferase involved in cell wall biosynthesis